MGTVSDSDFEVTTIIVEAFGVGEWQEEGQV